MKLKVKVEGLSGTLDALRALPEGTGRGVLRRLAVKALEPMAATARDLAPDDPRTGPPHDLKSSIAIAGTQISGRSFKRERDARGRYVRVYMGPTKDGYPQAMPQEFGAAQHPPHPFMRPAWDQHHEGALETISQGLGEAIEKTARRVAARAARRKAKG